MELYIVRHGIAIDREDPKSPADPERYLTEEGIDKTKQVAKRVAGFKIKPELFISSPYVRAMQTAELFAAAFDYPKQKIRRSDSLLPGTEPSHFFKEIAKEKNAAAIFCFGHAPQLDDLIAAGLGSKHHVTQLKKAGVAAIELKRLTPPSGQLLWLATPKLLRK
jgi:phosphohistidine phosphatase